MRLADDLQEHFYSQIKSIAVEGGYFDGLSAEVSGHLNAVIGGRGTWMRNRWSPISRHAMPRIGLPRPPRNRPEAITETSLFLRL